MIFYESLWKLMKAMIFHDIFSVQLLTFVPFHLIAMYYWHFIISYRDEQKFSVCYRTLSPLGNIGKYFTIIKRKVIFPISQILIQKNRTGMGKNPISLMPSMSPSNFKDKYFPHFFSFRGNPHLIGS